MAAFFPWEGMDKGTVAKLSKLVAGERHPFTEQYFVGSVPAVEAARADAPLAIQCCGLMRPERSDEQLTGNAKRLLQIANLVRRLGRVTTRPSRVITAVDPIHSRGRGSFSANSQPG
jgi:hypothetical protein